MDSSDIDVVRDTLIDEISRAFDGVTREGGISLREAEVIDDLGDDDERIAARLLDTEKRWQDVPARDIEYYFQSLTFLDAIGFRYYIPAFMIWTLREGRTSDSATTEFTIYDLCPGIHSERLQPSMIRQYGLLTEDQNAIVCRYLRFMVNHEGDEDAKLALESYWGQFCQNCD